MTNKFLKTVSFLAIILSASFFLSACGKKAETKKEIVDNSPASPNLELKQKPYISLIPRADGHELKLKINNIPSEVSQIDYELIYTAEDAGLEIEKGVGDTVKVDSRTIERDLLLGTASCTNGCKYKYDAGITGGTLSLTFSNKAGQSTTFETQFSFKSSADIKKKGEIGLSTENMSIKTSSIGTGEYFVLLKNMSAEDKSENKTVFSIFTSGNGSGKIAALNPASMTKENKNSLAGDYILE